MHPQSTRYGGDPNANLKSMLLLFLFFTVVAVTFWLYFRLRAEPDIDGEVVVGLPPQAA